MQLVREAQGNTLKGDSGKGDPARKEALARGPAGDRAGA